MNKQKKVLLGSSSVSLGNDLPFVLIAGPCVIESEQGTLALARSLTRLARGLKIPFVFKASYDKANRSSLRSYRGPGLKEGLRILDKVKRTCGVPVLIDVHTCEEAVEAAKTADMIQIPAFLCRQTDLVVACGKTGVPVNIKKGQFLAPEDMNNVAGKIESTGNRSIVLTERGATFGYHNLVVDYRGMEIMKGTGYPVVFDATHSVQLPGGLGHATGGQREFVRPLARAAAALGIAGIFVEVHPDPRRALSDGPNSLALKDVPRFLKEIAAIDRLVKKF
jgi:2-dehydro-3-deoxyphosphooctonate aldolase (KDO 8-P synthase)